MVRSLLLIVATLVVVVAAGCMPAAAGLTDAVTPGTTQSPVATPATDAAGELPAEIANGAVAWLAGEAGVAAEHVQVVAAEQVEWTDSCFGLGGPAESCLAEPIPGWRITFEAAGTQYEVRTDEAGSTFRLVPQDS